METYDIRHLDAAFGKGIDVERTRVLAFVRAERDGFRKERDEEWNLLTQTGNSFTPRLFYLDGALAALDELRAKVENKR